MSFQYHGAVLRVSSCWLSTLMYCLELERSGIAPREAPL
jgi:hypothetical protein